MLTEDLSELMFKTHPDCDAALAVFAEVTGLALTAPKLRPAHPRPHGCVPSAHGFGCAHGASCSGGHVHDGAHGGGGCARSAAHSGGCVHHGAYSGG